MSYDSRGTINPAGSIFENGSWMSVDTIVGIFASALTATSLLPQLIKLIKEKKSQGVSIVMLAVLFTGLALWIVYGILKSDFIIVVSNSFALVINFLIGILTIRYKGQSG